VGFPLFSAVWTLWTMPRDDGVTFVGGGAKFGWFSRLVRCLQSGDATPPFPTGPDGIGLKALK